MKSNPAGTLAVLRSLGVTRVRVFVEWSGIAPSPNSRRRPGGFNAANPAAYPAANWAVYDNMVRAAAGSGIGLDFTLTGPAPLWATGSGMPRGGPYGQWKPSASQFKSFVHAVGTRYSGRYRPAGATTPLPRVNFWAIWNEPNFGVDLAPQTTDHNKIETGAVLYRGLLNAAWSGLQSTGHGRDTILIGETAPRGVNAPGNFSGVKPLRFLRALYCVDSRYRQLTGSAARQRGCPTTKAGRRRFRAANPALFKASAFADHPYTRQGAEVAPNVPTSLNPHSHKSDPDFADLPEIPRLERTLDRLQRVYGSRKRFNVWNTEYGYRIKPPDANANIGPATAALFMNWAEYLSWRQRRVASFSQYLLRDSPTGFFASGLELANGTPTLLLSAYRMPLFLPVSSTKRGRKVQVWGAVRPAHFAALTSHRTQRVSIQFQAGSRGAFKTVSTATIRNVRGYFDVKVKFPRSGSVRLAWTDPTGHTDFSRTTRIKVR